MPGADVDLSTRVTGPLADGRAQLVVTRILDDTARELGQGTRRDIRAAARAMNKTGRGGTGEAARGVSISYGDAVIVRGGIREGKFSWPWLEGTSQRNQSTPFGGYHAFAAAAARMADRAQQVLDKHAGQGARQMGGS
jgi:hypothetical protein